MKIMRSVLNNCKNVRVTNRHITVFMFVINTDLLVLGNIILFYVGYAFYPLFCFLVFCSLFYSLSI